MIGGFNDERVARAEARLKVGFGIATGEVVAGYAGTDSRATYTCIGKTVNLASRLEAHTKVIDRAILFDAQTHRNLADRAGCLKMPAALFKGFSGKIEVFSLQRAT